MVGQHKRVVGVFAPTVIRDFGDFMTSGFFERPMIVPFGTFLNPKPDEFGLMFLERGSVLGSWHHIARIITKDADEQF